MTFFKKRKERKRIERKLWREALLRDVRDEIIEILDTDSEYKRYKLTPNKKMHLAIRIANEVIGKKL